MEFYATKFNFNLGNVGIGTASPSTTAGAKTLEVHGSSALNSEIRLTNATSGQGSADGFSLILDGSSNVYLMNREDGNMYLGTNNSTKLTISSLGFATFTNGISASRDIASFGANTGSSANRMALSMEGSGVSRLIANGINTSTKGVFQVFTATSNGTGVVDLSISGGLATFNNGTSLPLLQLKTSRTDISYGIELYHSSSSLYGYIGGTGAGVLTGAVLDDLIIRAQTNLIFASGGNNRRLTISSGGDILFGTTGIPNGTSIYGSAFKDDSKSRMTLVQASDNNNLTDLQEYFNSNGAVGKIQTNGSATLFTTSSDYRLKENVNPITNAIARVNQLKPSRFNFIADADRTVDGFIAHEVQDIIPEAISGEKDAMKDEEFVLTPMVEAVTDEEGNVITEAVEAVMQTRTVPDYQGIDQSKIVPLLTAAIQEQQTIIDSLINRLEALEA